MKFEDKDAIRIIRALIYIFIVSPIFRFLEWLGLRKRPVEMTQGQKMEFAKGLMRYTIEALEESLESERMTGDKRALVENSIQDLHAKIEEIERQELWDSDPRDWHREE